MRWTILLLLCVLSAAGGQRTSFRTEEGAVVGSNVVVNGNFAVDANWTKPAGLTISGGKANWTTGGLLRQDVTLDSGAYYEFIYSVSDYSAVGNAINVQGWTDTSPLRYGPGTFREIIFFSGGSSAIFINGANSFAGSVSNITVRKITPVTINWSPRVVDITGDSIAQHQAVTYPDTFPGDTASGHSLAQDDITPVDCSLGNTTFHWTATNGILQCLSNGAPTIIIHDGINDINTARTWSDVLADLSTIRTLVTTQDLFIDEILPWSNGTDGQALTVRTWNTNLAYWVTTNNAHLIKSHDAMGKTRVSTGYLDDLKTIYDSDGVHPGTGGEYVLWTLWMNGLESVYGFPVSTGYPYCVSSSLGNDANPGTASAPWKTLTNVYALRAGFQPGDSILLKAGDSFDGELEITQSGTNGAPIKVGRYGTGANPIVYGDHPTATWTAVGGHAGVYSATVGPPSAVQLVYDANGILYTNIARGTNTLDNWLNTFVATNSGFVDGGASASTVYVKIGAGTPSQMHLFEHAAVTTWGNYDTVENLEVCNSFIGIQPTLGQNLLIYSNFVHDTMNCAIYFSSCDHSTMASNTVLRTGNTQLYMQNGGSNWIHHNVGSYSGSNSSGCTILGIHVGLNDDCAIGLQQGTNNLVERNSFSNIYSALLDYFFEDNTESRFNYGFHCGTGLASHGMGCSLHHNIVDLDGVGVGGVGAQAYDPAQSHGPSNNTNKTVLFNNVVYNCIGYGLTSATGSLLTGTSTNVVFRNNLIGTTSTSTPLGLFYSGLDSDYNLFYCTAGQGKWEWNDASYTSLATMRAASGQEAHSLDATPQFVSSNPTNAVDFALKAASPGVDAGTSMGAGLTAYDGTSIPQGAGPDIGAYETNSQASSVTMTTLTVNGTCVFQ